MKGRNTRTVLLRQLLLLLGVSFCNAAYIVTVPFKDEECFTLASHKSDGTFFGNFELIDDGENKEGGRKKSKLSEPLTLVVMDSSSSRIFYRSRRGATEGNFKVQVTKGQRLDMCVQNGIYASGRRKTPIKNEDEEGPERIVGLTYSFEEKDPNMELHSQNVKLLSATRNVFREIGRLKDHYAYVRAREALHRETVEATFSRLMSWTLLQGFTVVLIAVGQIMYFRRFLEQRRYM